MVLERNICFVLLSFVVLIKCAVGVIPAPNFTVECTETGFKPSIAQTYVADTEVYFDVALGDGSDGCNATSNVTASGDGSEVIGVLRLISDVADEIPYQRLGGIACNGSLGNNEDNTSIVFALGAEVIVTQVLRKVIKRQQKFDFNVKCILTRDAAVVSSQGDGGKWKISSELERTGNVQDKNETFELKTKLEFFKTTNYADVQDAEFQLKAGDRLYVKISEVNANTHLKFVVNRCWSTPNSSPVFATQDIFFNKGCPIDSTVTFTDAASSDDNHYKFEMQAFFFSIGKALAIYVHCDLYICQSQENSQMCKQPDKADCDTRGGRRRRSVDGEPIEQTIVSSQQHIVFDNSEIYAPTCAEGYVYDRMSKVCTKQNVFEIRGVYLDIPWNPLYANASSTAFAEFAKVKEYQLYALVQSATTERVIRGLKVVKATKGSVVLDVQVKYADTSDSQTAFKEFETALRTTRVTTSRVLNILNIKERPLKRIEYVPVMATTRSKMNVTLLVVIVVLFVVVFISGITLYKVKQLRRSPTTTTTTTTKDVNGFDNRAMDNMS